MAPHEGTMIITQEVRLFVPGGQVGVAGRIPSESGWYQRASAQTLFTVRGTLTSSIASSRPSRSGIKTPLVNSSFPGRPKT
jgi:hypothetical protein